MTEPRDRASTEVPPTEPGEPADPAAKTQPAEGGREEAEESLRRADAGDGEETPPSDAGA
jgi:hypothetical protein